MGKESEGREERTDGSVFATFMQELVDRVQVLESQYVSLQAQVGMLQSRVDFLSAQAANRR